MTDSINYMDDIIDFNDDTTAKSDNMEESEIFYPDGFGLKIEDVRALLAKHNDSIVAKDDPILLIVTILNAFLYENEKLNNKYNDALKTMFSEQTQQYLENVQQATQSISATLSSISVDGLRKIQTDNTIQQTIFITSLHWTTAIIGISALVNVCAFILR